MVRSGVRGEREGRAEPATSVSGATRDQSGPAIGPTCSSRLGGAAAAGRTMVRSTAAPSRLVNLFLAAFHDVAHSTGVVPPLPPSLVLKREAISRAPTSPYLATTRPCAV